MNPSDQETDSLILYIERNNPCMTEYIRVGLLWYLGMPVRRSGNVSPRPTPGCIRVRLYNSKEALARRKCWLDQVDFPLDSNGNFNLQQINAWWGIQDCKPIDPIRWRLFESADPNRLSPLAVNNLTDDTRVMCVYWNEQPGDTFKAGLQGMGLPQIKWIMRETVTSFGSDSFLKRYFAVCLVILVVAEWPIFYADAGILGAVLQFATVVIAWRMNFLLGPTALIAFFHKPSAPSMVILEIDRDFGNFPRLLGAHKWSEVLTDPTQEQSVRVTRIYYCKHSNSRDIEKDGWKRIDIKDNWFRSWDFRRPFLPREDENGKFFEPNRVAYPYPASHYCDLPSEANSNKPMCCPLPVKLFPPPPSRPEPPVGSSQWLEARGNGSQSQSLSSSKSKKKKKKVGNQLSTSGLATPSTRTSVSRPPSDRDSPAPDVTSTASQSNARNTAPSGMNAAPRGLNATAPPFQSNAAWSSNTTPTIRADQVPLPPPPGLPPKPTAAPQPAKMLWSDYPEDSDDDLEITLGNANARADGDGDGDGDGDIDSDDPSTVSRAMAAFANEDDDDDDEFTFPNPPVNAAQFVDAPADDETDSSSLWEHYHEPEAETSEWRCKFHGVKCTKLCQERHKYEREKKRQKEAEAGVCRGGRGGRGRGRGGRGRRNRNAITQDAEGSGSNPPSRERSDYNSSDEGTEKETHTPSASASKDEEDAWYSRDWTPNADSWNMNQNKAGGWASTSATPWDSVSNSGRERQMRSSKKDEVEIDDGVSESGWTNVSEGPW
ncbi:hypothetical protein EW146_g5834 [Bondarzewia mesenterica]|uniref:Uncharacterized protein n=1 Tax=Bondarzewia mesenterica TaxID=1095465 RepID=A0A4S4LSB9_9AGAM|nr:hypothetical protein EW146_g5834 [Bondarzewia mesenterica]